jgi:hypothetical protein
VRSHQGRPSGFEPTIIIIAAGVGRKAKQSDVNHRSRHEAIPSPLCPILSKIPLSTSQIITPTTPATNARKKAQKHQQTIVRFFFLLCWRASQESL